MADDVAITAGSGTTVATDERTIAAVAKHVQRVDEQGATAVGYGQTTVTNTATSIAAARDTRKVLTLRNLQTVAVYIGDASVATTTGFRLDPGDAMDILTTAAVYGITSAAYTATGDAKVHFIEEYDA